MTTNTDFQKTYQVDFKYYSDVRASQVVTAHNEVAALVLAMNNLPTESWVNCVGFSITIKLKIDDAINTRGQNFLSQYNQRTNSVYSEEGMIRANSEYHRMLENFDKKNSVSTSN